MTTPMKDEAREDLISVAYDVDAHAEGTAFGAIAQEFLALNAALEVEREKTKQLETEIGKINTLAYQIHQSNETLVWPEGSFALIQKKIDKLEAKITEQQAAITRMTMDKLLENRG